VLLRTTDGPRPRKTRGRAPRATPDRGAREFVMIAGTEPTEQEMSCPDFSGKTRPGRGVV